MKATVEEVVGIFGRRADFCKRVYEYLHDGRSAEITVDGEYVGYIGEIHPNVAENYDLTERVYVAEINLSALMKYTKTVKFTAIPKYPNVERDLALIVDEGLAAGNLIRHIAEFSELIEKAELFDVYRGAQVGEGKKSVALNVSFRAPDHTLKDEEVQAVMGELLTSLETAFACKLR